MRMLKRLNKFRWKIAGIVMALFFCAPDLDAQLPSIMLMSDDSTWRGGSTYLQTEFRGFAGSSALDNAFINKLVFGGRISDEHTNRLLDKMDDQNNAGFMQTSSLDLYNFRDTLFVKPHRGLKISVSSSNHGAMSFNKNLYSAVFNGNQQWRGDTVALGPFSLDYQAWQKFGVGIFNKNNLSSVTLSLVSGQQYESMIVSQADLYTSPLADTMQLYYRGEYLRSDSSHRGWANGSGLGLALDLNYNLPLNDRKGLISVSLLDLGFVRWNNLGQRMSLDSSTTWTGVNVDEIFSGNSDSLQFPALSDSIHRDVRQGKFTQALPATVNLRYCRFINDRDFYELGVTMWPNRAALPLLYAGVSHFLGNQFVFTERLAYGGYGKFGLGMEMQWMPCGTWVIRAGTSQLSGWILPSAHARDFYLNIGKRF